MSNAVNIIKEIKAKFPCGAKIYKAGKRNSYTICPWGRFDENEYLHKGIGKWARSHPWGRFLGQCALVYRISGEADKRAPKSAQFDVWRISSRPGGYDQRVIPASVLEWAYKKISQGQNLTASDCLAEFHPVFESDSCNFRALGGIFKRLGYAKYLHDIIVAGSRKFANASQLKSKSKRTVSKTVRAQTVRTQVVEDKDTPDEHVPQSPKVELAGANFKPSSIRNGWFKWPEIKLNRRGRGSGNFSAILSPLVGIFLSPPYEYRVGKKGKSDVARQKILDRIFHDELQHRDKKYLAQFGAPKSPARLRKMANVLKWLATNRLNDERDYSETISHYKKDLGYLYDRYYVGEFRYHKGPGADSKRRNLPIAPTPSPVEHGGKIPLLFQSSPTARPYADAVFQLAQEANDFDRWSAFLARAAAVVGDAQIVRLIQDPRVEQETLFSIIADLSVVGDGGDEQRNFLRVLIVNRRALALAGIAAQFEKLRAEAEGTVDASLVTAFAVSDAQKEKIAAALGEKLGRRVRLSVSEDRDLIGGAIVRAGDVVIDASARGRLAKLSATLAE